MDGVLFAICDIDVRVSLAVLGVISAKVNVNANRRT